MKHFIITIALLSLISCTEGDKQREDFPSATQKGEKETQGHIGEGDSVIKSHPDAETPVH